MSKVYEVEGEYVGGATLLVRANDEEEALERFHAHIKDVYKASPIQSNIHVRKYKE